LSSRSPTRPPLPKAQASPKRAISCDSRACVVGAPARSRPRTWIASGKSSKRRQCHGRQPAFVVAPHGSGAWSPGPCRSRSPVRGAARAARPPVGTGIGRPGRKVDDEAPGRASPEDSRSPGPQAVNNPLPTVTMLRNSKQGGPETPPLKCSLWSGWGDLNSRPLDPQLEYDRFTWCC